MKLINKLGLLTALLLSLTACVEDVCEETILVQGFAPQTITADEWRNGIIGCFAYEPVCQATGFYVYEQYLFMVENNEGMHIFDNTDSANPEPITFLRVSGAQGLAVRNDILYLNQFTDLLSFDLSNPELPELIHRTEDAFSPGSIFTNYLPDGTFITDWAATGVTREIPCGQSDVEFWEDQVFFTNNFRGINAFASADLAVANVASGSGGETVGVGGSLARFTINQGNLYAVDDNSLRAFSLADPRKPEFATTIGLDNWAVETIFPYEDKLFIGTNNGLYIYGLEDPLNPEHLSTFSHVLGCDPVVVDNDKAYVTLWGGRDCGSTGDQLEIIDVSDARNPVSLQLTPMSSSHGLSVAEGKLFLCSQWEGFRTFDLDDDGLLGEELDHVQDINARDVIVLPAQNRAIVLGYGADGIQQYDYSDEGELTATSKIDVCDN